jgi:LPXTG-motif cell wall-anchored protein
MLAACGVVMLLFGITALPAQGAAPARPLLQPSPRPAIDPLRHRGGSAADMGHITGTVIDLRTGAPAPGVAVNVGGETVLSDANGNYDHWLPAGTYSVALALSAEQGTAEQDVLTVNVLPAVPTIQHLNYRSPAPAAAPAAEPAAAPKPAPAAAPTAAAAAAEPPKRLPRTGADGGSAWMWLGFGMLLVLCGGLFGFGPVLNGRSAAAVIRRHVANHQLLQVLLSQPARDELLAALFEAHDRRK